MCVCVWGEKVKVKVSDSRVVLYMFCRGSQTTDQCTCVCVCVCELVVNWRIQHIHCTFSTFYFLVYKNRESCSVFFQWLACQIMNGFVNTFILILHGTEIIFMWRVLKEVFKMLNSKLNWVVLTSINVPKSNCVII